MSAQYKVFLQILAQTTTRSDLSNQDSQILNLAFVGIQNIMHSLSEPTELAAYLDDFYNQFVSTSQLEGWKREVVQQGLLTVMHVESATMLGVPDPLQPDDPQAAGPVDPGAEGGRVVPLDHRVLQEYRRGELRWHLLRECDGDVYAAPNTIDLQKQFTPYCQDFLSYLQHALQKRSDADSFKASIYSIADIARAIGADFSQYQQTLTFYQQLIEVACASMQDPNLDRELKLHIYSSMADIVFGLGREVMSCSYLVIECLKIGF